MNPRERAMKAINCSRQPWCADHQNQIDRVADAIASAVEAAEKERDAWRDENKVLAERVLKYERELADTKNAFRSAWTRAEMAEKRLAELTDAAQDYVDRSVQENQHRLVDVLSKLGKR